MKALREDTVRKIIDLTEFLTRTSGDDPQTMAHVDAVLDALEVDALAGTSREMQVAELERIAEIPEERES